jgi:hypothetical protein
VEETRVAEDVDGHDRHARLDGKPHKALVEGADLLNLGIRQEQLGNAARDQVQGCAVAQTVELNKIKVWLDSNRHSYHLLR